MKRTGVAWVPSAGVVGKWLWVVLWAVRNYSAQPRWEQTLVVVASRGTVPQRAMKGVPSSTVLADTLERD